ncbi:MAG: class I SAM-dependent methyltransferase [Candidatus Devosia symbiotica]|nr:class I SAM-dependent methyltransferase [Candidatus Devosia symbiotica]
MIDYSAIAPYGVYFCHSLYAVAADLESYAVLLQRWQAVQNRISRETPAPDVITCRTLASLPQLFGWMVPFVTPTTRAILYKGREHIEEFVETVTGWDFNVVLMPSDTDRSGVLLTLTNLSRNQ